MEYQLNEERQNYLKSRGKIILKACPGSGKTTTVAYKLKTLIEEHKLTCGNYSGIACLSFTNTAKDEIEEKYKLFNSGCIAFPHIVSTIDSFINQYIVLPHYHLLKKESVRPKILESGFSLNDLPLYHLNSYRRSNVPLRKIYYPSDVSINISGQLLYKGSIPNGTHGEKQTFNEYAKALKKWQFNKGFLTSNDTGFVALKLLGCFPEIGKALVKRFPTIIIDEGQDTSEIQFAIIDKLIENGLENIEIIGDPYQSLYEWREARPDLFEERFNDRENWTSLKLDKCLRSVQKIVNQYQILRNETTELRSNIEENDIPISVIRYTEGSEIAALDKYLEISERFKDKCIAVRGKTLLNTLEGKNGNSVLPWKSSIPYSIMYSKEELSKGNTKKAINELRKIIPELFIPDSDYGVKRNLINDLRTDFETNCKLFEVLSKIPEYERTLAEWTNETQQFLQELFNLPLTPNFDLKQGVWRPLYSNQMIAIFEMNEELPKPISTIHRIKGNTFDSLLLFLSKNSSGQNISINDIATPTGFPDEKKRMIYVAMSRPRHQLVIAICDNKSEDEIKAILGNEINIINL
jgi:DNA helicase-2/ATP-dependent DNA helicase PcrA